MSGSAPAGRTGRQWHRHEPPRRSRSCKARLQTEIERARADGSPLTVVLIDVDHFKRIDDIGGQGERTQSQRQRGILRPMQRAELVAIRIAHVRQMK